MIDWRDWYIVGGKVSIAETLERWKRLCDEAMAKGFKGLRVTGETASFFRERRVKQLVEYEQALHRVLELPMAAKCAYDSRVVANERGGELYLDLIKAHSNVIIVGPEAGVVKSH